MILRAAMLVVAAAVVTGCGARTTVRPERHVVYLRHLSSFETTQVWITDAAGKHARKLVTNASGGAVSPDGRRVAFGRRDGHDLWIVDSDGSDVRLVARKTDLLDWLPDGRILALRGRALVAVSVDGATSVLDGDARGMRGWSLSPDGRRIVYARAVPHRLGEFCGNGADLYVVRLAGGTPNRLTFDGRDSYPVWGPRQIAFRRDVRDCIAGGIWTIRPNGSALRPLAPRPLRRYAFDGYYGYKPFAWLRDGKRLLIGLTNEWGDDAAILEPDGRVRSLRYHVDVVSRDRRSFLGVQGGAEVPYDVTIVRIGDRRARVVAHGAVCCADWNR